MVPSSNREINTGTMLWTKLKTLFKHHQYFHQCPFSFPGPSVAFSYSSQPPPAYNKLQGFLDLHDHNTSEEYPSVILQNVPVWFV